MPRDVSLSDSKCWNGGQKWVNCCHWSETVGVGPRPSLKEGPMTVSVHGAFRFQIQLRKFKLLHTCIIPLCANNHRDLLDSHILNILH